MSHLHDQVVQAHISFSTVVPTFLPHIAPLFVKGIIFVQLMEGIKTNKQTLRLVHGKAGLHEGTIDGNHTIVCLGNGSERW